jgi:hypothetical protein
MIKVVRNHILPTLSSRFKIVLKVAEREVQVRARLPGRSDEAWQPIQGALSYCM